MTRPTMEARRAELYADIEDCVRHALLKSGIADAPADAAAVAIVDMLAADWAGQNLTFPRNLFNQVAQRDADILARMGRVGISELAREHGISERAVRKAYHRARLRTKQTAGSAQRCGAGGEA